MRAASALLLAGISALSASTPHSSFRYEVQTSFRRQDQDSCQMCFKDDCIVTDRARCQYYTETAQVLADEYDADDGQITEVDEMMFDLVARAQMSWDVHKCIPMISYYSDCSKENICMGCTTCTCNMSGQWSCSFQQKCRPDHELDIDHRVLNMVIEKLMESDQLKRKKRANQNVTETENNDLTEKPKAAKMSFADIAEWMYGVRPNVTTDLAPSTNSRANITGGLTKYTEYVTQLTTTSFKPTEPEYLGFEEVLKNIASDDQTYKRRKSQLKDKENYDYMDLDDVQIVKSNVSDQFIDVLNAIEQGSDEVRGTTDAINDATFVVDLYPRGNYNDKNITVSVQNIDLNNFYKEDNNTIDYTVNDRIDLDAINIMKRDIASVTQDSNTTETTNSTVTTTFSERLETTTDMNSDLKDNVLNPLSKIIDDKQHEVKELILIRENLMRFIKNYNNMKVNITKEPDDVNGSNTYFSIYKLDLVSDIQENLRILNPNVLNKLLYKLKRDVYEVLRDISKIQKFSHSENLPDDLRMLIRYMKYYLHKQGNVRMYNKKNIKIENPKTVQTRRLWLRPVKDGSSTAKDIKNKIIDILQTIDKSQPKTDALASLSRSTKHIMKRVIKQNFIDDVSVLGLQIYDTGYNLTDDLKSIGKAWPKLTDDLEKSSPHQKLHAMKSLYLIMSNDITKIKDAITIVNFAHSRRMIPIETSMAEYLMEKIHSGLDLIKTKVKFLIKYHDVNKNMRTELESNTKKKVKESFLKKLRNILRHSKKDIVNMANQNIPKSKIVKTIAKKQFHELAQKNNYEQTMLKWQNRLNIVRRKRRDLETQLKRMKNRMKNIIPKYLRGKINPAIAKKRKAKKQKGVKKKPNNLNKNNTAAKATIAPSKTNNLKTGPKKNSSTKQKSLTTPKAIQFEDNE